MFEEENRHEKDDETICSILLQNDDTLKFINFLDSTIGQQSSADAVRLSLLDDDRNLHNLCLTINVYKTNPPRNVNSQTGAFLVKMGENKAIKAKKTVPRKSAQKRSIRRKTKSSSTKITAKELNELNEFVESVCNPNSNEKRSKKPKISKNHFLPEIPDTLPLSSFVETSAVQQQQPLSPFCDNRPDEIGVVGGGVQLHLPFSDNRPPDYDCGDDHTNRTPDNDENPYYNNGQSSSNSSHDQQQQLISLGFVEEIVHNDNNNHNNFENLTTKADNCNCSICQENRTLPPSLRRAYHRCSIDGCDRVYRHSAHPQHMFYWHQGPKPLTCTYDGCGKTFVRHHDLTRHVRTHTGVKPFLCDTCGKGFVDRGHLVKHIRTHTGGREYECPECKKKFGGSATLRKHARTHSNVLWAQYPD